MSEGPPVPTGPSEQAEGDSDQLPAEDTLLSTGPEDGYTPPVEEPDHHPSTPFEEATGETLDQRLDREQPEVWDQTPTRSPDAPDALG